LHEHRPEVPVVLANPTLALRDFASPGRRPSGTLAADAIQCAAAIANAAACRAPPPLRGSTRRGQRR